MKIGVGVSVLVVNGSADVIITNAYHDIEEREFSVRDCVRKLKSRMKVGYEANIVFQVHAARPCDSDDVIDVPLV